MWISRRRDQDRLSDYWNALVRNAPPNELARRSEAIDPANRTAIERVQALHRSHRPEPDFANQLETNLMNAFATSAGAIPLPVTVPYPNGRRMPKRSAWLPELGVGTTRRRWALASFAAALLILLAGIGGYFLYESQTDQPAVVPATQEATPGSGWTHYKGNAARSGVANAGPTGTPIELWRFQAQSACGQAPIVVGETVIAGCRDGNLYALNASDGSEIWTYAADAPIGLGLSAAGNLVYVIDDFGTLYAVDISTGEEAWRFESPVTTHPAIEEGLLVTGTDNGVLVGIEAETGSELWRSEVHDGRPLNTPAIANGLVYAASQAGGMVAVDVERGELRWQTDTAEGSAGTSVVADGIVFSTVILPDTTARQFALDALTGEILWQREGDIQNPDVSDGIGYSHGLGGLVQAFNTQDGSELWHVQVGGPTRAGAVAGDVHYSPSDGDRSIYALDAATGEELWRFAVDGNIDGSIAVADGRLYVTTMAGSVYAIGGSDEPLIAPVSDTDQVAPVELLWQQDGGPWRLTASVDGAFDLDGNLWVVDICNNRFQIFDLDGTFLESWGESGSGPGQFNFCGDGYSGRGDLTFDAQGNLYVVDVHNDRIQKFDREREFVTEWGGFGGGDGQFLNLSSIAINGDGNIVVCDFDRSDCQVFDPDGQFLFAFGGGGAGEAILSKPGWVTSDADGNVYVSDLEHSQVFKFDSDGSLLQTLGGPGEGPGQFLGPTDIAFGAEGTIYVADPQNRRVQVFDAQGTYLAEWGGSMTRLGVLAPIGLTIDDDGNIYVFDGLISTFFKFRLLPPLGSEATPGA